jgi:shikimate kinase
MPPAQRHIVLIGYRGCGKTTVGRLLAERLNLPFVDTDALIVERAGRTIADIFDTEGEAGFRTREAEIVAEVAKGPPAVISLGGGAVLLEANMECLSATSRVIWLLCRPETLHARIVGDPASGESRPSLTGRAGLEEVRTVLAQREPLYDRWADTAIDSTERTAEEAAGALQEWLTQARS